MGMLGRGALFGAAYGLAFAVVDTWQGTLMMMNLGMPPFTAVTLRAVSLELAVGVVAGIVVAPLLRVRSGWLWHLLGMTAVWVACERIVALDPTILPMWLTAPLGALLLILLGRAVARWSAVVPWAIGIVAVAAAITLPVARYQRAASGGIVPAVVAPPPDAPDVVLVVLDTVRAANVSAYGYARATTPTFDALAGEGALFLDATAPSTWSLPSHASLFTGWFPSGHRAHGEHRVLGATPPTLAEVLASAGYETRCFTANPHISDGFGLTRGFGWSDEAWAAGAGGRGFRFIFRLLDLLGFGIDDKGGAAVATNFETWMAARAAGGRPTFAFLNFLEAHFPYHQLPAAYLRRYTTASAGDLRAASVTLLGAQFGRALAPDEVPDAAAAARDMYDAGVLYSDHLLARVVEALRAAGTLDRTVLVVLADHGEMLGEYGSFGHGASLREPGVRVPLLVRYPPRVAAGARVTPPVSTVGVYATVLDLAGLAPTPVHVGSLLPTLDGRPAGAPVLAERYVFPDRPSGGEALARRDRRYRTYRAGSWKLVETSKAETFLFNLAADPDEGHDLAPTRPDQVARLTAERDDWLAALALPPLDATADFQPAPDVDSAVEERLRALGYVR
jgi:arylsulfatase A-like enzyme